MNLKRIVPAGGVLLLLSICYSRAEDSPGPARPVAGDSKPVSEVSYAVWKQVKEAFLKKNAKFIKAYIDAGGVDIRTTYLTQEPYFSKRKWSSKRHVYEETNNYRMPQQLLLKLVAEPYERTATPDTRKIIRVLTDDDNFLWDLKVPQYTVETDDYQTFRWVLSKYDYERRLGKYNWEIGDNLENGRRYPRVRVVFKPVGNSLKISLIAINQTMFTYS